MLPKQELVNNRNWNTSKHAKTSTKKKIACIGWKKIKHLLMK